MIPTGSGNEVPQKLFSAENEQLKKAIASKKEDEVVVVVKKDFGGHRIEVRKKEKLSELSTVFQHLGRNLLEVTMFDASDEVDPSNLQKKHQVKSIEEQEFLDAFSATVAEVKKVGAERLTQLDIEAGERKPEPIAVYYFYTPNETQRNKSAAIIQRCFRAFSSKRNEMAYAERIRVANRRQRQAPNEPLLFESEVNSATKSEFTREQLRVWSDMTIGLVGVGTKEDLLIAQNHRINQLLQRNLSRIEPGKCVLKLIYDSAGNAQASALLKMGEHRKKYLTTSKVLYGEVVLPLYISYISTAPWNLPIDANKGQQRRVKGAATALIESAIHESIRRGFKGALALESVPEAESFYEEICGFVRKPWTPSEEDLIPMELSAKAARAFLASERAGRAMPAEEIVSEDSDIEAGLKIIEDELSKIPVPRFQEGVETSLKKLKSIELKLVEMQSIDAKTGAKKITKHMKIVDTTIEKYLKEVRNKIFLIEGTSNIDSIV